KQLIARHDVDTILLGLPIGKSGNPSARSREVTAFGRLLHQATGLPVCYHSERSSTVQARMTYAEVCGKPFRRRDSPLDRIAATIILESYLSSRNEQ
ncbi:MAG: Holliday junction resolvase RuvX, partial [candidate division WOR-3 bacterium]